MLHQSSNQYRAAGCPDGLSARQRQNIEDQLHRVAFEGHAAIAQRLAGLDAEWSAGRVAKVIVAGGILCGLAAAVFVSTWWLILPVALGLLLLQYLISRDGWMTTALKPLGLRSGVEIEHERFALKALRGDFHHLPIVYERADEDALSRMEDEGGPVVDDDPPSLSDLSRAAVREVVERVHTHH